SGRRREAAGRWGGKWAWLSARSSFRLPRGGRGGLGKCREQLAPIAGLVEDRAHLVATRAVSIEPPMLEFDPRVGLALGDEAHLDLRLQAGIILPIGGDVPGEHQARMRLPGEHATPVTGASVLAPVVPAPAHPWLHAPVHG